MPEPRDARAIIDNAKQTAALVRCLACCEVKAGRDKLFIHPNLMKLLTAEDHGVPKYHV